MRSRKFPPKEAGGWCRVRAPGALRPRNPPARHDRPRSILPTTRRDPLWRAPFGGGLRLDVVLAGKGRVLYATTRPRRPRFQSGPGVGRGRLSAAGPLICHRGIDHALPIGVIRCTAGVPYRASAVRAHDQVRAVFPPAALTSNFCHHNLPIWLGSLGRRMIRE